MNGNGDTTVPMSLMMQMMDDQVSVQWHVNPNRPPSVAALALGIAVLNQMLQDMMRPRQQVQMAPLSMSDLLKNFPKRG